MVLKSKYFIYNAENAKKSKWRKIVKNSTKYLESVKWRDIVKNIEKIKKRWKSQIIVKNIQKVTYKCWKWGKILKKDESKAKTVEKWWINLLKKVENAKNGDGIKKLENS